MDLEVTIIPSIPITVADLPEASHTRTSASVETLAPAVTAIDPDLLTPVETLTEQAPTTLAVPVPIEVVINETTDTLESMTAAVEEVIPTIPLKTKELVFSIASKDGHPWASRNKTEFALQVNGKACQALVFRQGHRYRLSFATDNLPLEGDLMPGAVVFTMDPVGFFEGIAPSVIPGMPIIAPGAEVMFEPTAATPNYFFFQASNQGFYGGYARCE